MTPPRWSGCTAASRARSGATSRIGVLDIGTTKMCCLIARRRPGGGLEVLGAGYQLAEGLRAGEIVDAEAAEASILAVVHEAEQQARETLREVVLGLSAGRPRSLRSTVELELERPRGDRRRTSPGRSPTPAPRRGSRAARRCTRCRSRSRLDGGQPLRDPRGMIGRRLRARGPSGPGRGGAVAQPGRGGRALPSRGRGGGRGALRRRHRQPERGRADARARWCSTSAAASPGVARFADGRLQDIHTVPLGGRHVTQDLAFGLSTGWPQAERLKTLYGSVLSRAGDAHQRLEVPGLGDPDDPPLQIVSRARLTEIMRPRVEEIFQLVRARLAETELPLVGRRLVLTGGGSTLEGVVELAEETFGMPARLGRGACRSTGGSRSPACPAARPRPGCCAGPIRMMAA